MLYSDYYKTSIRQKLKFNVVLNKYILDKKDNSCYNKFVEGTVKHGYHLLL